MKSASEPFAASSINAIVVDVVIVVTSEWLRSANPNLLMNHDGHLVIAQAVAPHSAPTSYTTPRGAIRWPVLEPGLAAEQLIAVGMPVARPPPRTDPGVRNSRTGLLP